MGCILLGSILSFVVATIIWCTGEFIGTKLGKTKGEEKVEEIFGTVGILMVILGVIISIFVGIFSPVSGYKEAKFEEGEKLLSIRCTTLQCDDSIIYVSVSEDNIYTYYTATWSDYALETGITHEAHTLPGNLVTVEEDGKYTEATLVKYSSKAKSTFWTFGVNKKIEYVFYVPKGTVLRCQ